MKILDRILPSEDKKRKRVAIVVVVITASLLTLLGIHGIGQYGIALFILTPFFIGLASTILYGYKGISYRESIKIGLITLLIFTIGLLVFAIEGLICIAMAAPIGLGLTWIGSVIGYAIIRKSPKNAPISILLLMGIIPIMSFIEKDQKPDLNYVTTSIEICAPPEVVWKNVIEFPELNQPDEFIFKTGIAYPVNAEIKGSGKSAIRYCNFTTGSFIEPITVWDEPHLLRFDVMQQPQPMKELSFWNIDAPHLHDYFVSKQGQFRLIALPNGNTRLEGTTWYYHNIRPSAYWKLWSDYIIHKIHDRVLTHIKSNSENTKQ